MKNIQVRVEDTRRRIMDKKEVKNRFSFRKLSTGLATVFLGSIFFWTNGQTVQADSVESASEQAVQNFDSQAQAGNTVSENTVNEENGSTSETTTEVETEMPSVDTPDTGISRQFFRKQTQMFKQYGLKVQAFFAGNENLRGPLHEGLPTLEYQRNYDPLS